ncbi:MAG: carbohydrate porin [Alphaproteobacteria bacterium]|nr:carbohydrate porin [Alphaproteobacteria bacterium]MBR1757059.1 carbohydrate porin [Alphaproteobacteria bacterium]
MQKSLFYGVVVGILALSTVAGAATIGSDYSAMKNYLNKKYGLSYNLNYSLMAQHGAPNGRYNPVQSYLNPSVAWTTFNNGYGTGVLNASYSSVFYGNHNADDVANRIGVVTPINDEDDESQEFSTLYYTYQLPNRYNWLTFGLGQYTIYNFDGTDYNNNPQGNFINYALAQNGSATYAEAGVGTYIQATPGNWLFVAGVQDASNISATSVRFNRLHDGHYTTFGQIGYNPTVQGLGAGQYSVLVYNQPYVREQPQSTTGWSLNMQQNIGEKWAVFGRINGVSGSVATIKNSYSVGMVFNNPLDRNPLDQIGTAYAYNDIDETAVGEPLSESGEHILEAFWTWGISKWAAITPDIQFYINPALNTGSDYATVASLRFNVYF